MMNDRERAKLCDGLYEIAATLELLVAEVQHVACLVTPEAVPDQPREHAGAARPSQAVSEERAECCGGFNGCQTPDTPDFEQAWHDMLAFYATTNNSRDTMFSSHYTVTYHGFPVGFAIVEL